MPGTDQTSTPAYPSEPMRGRAWIGVLAAIGAIAFLAYLPSIRGAFVWDDLMIQSGEAIGGGKSLRDCLVKPFLGHYFRPLVSASFYLDRLVLGPHPMGYHIENMALHSAAAVACALLVAALFGSRITGMVAGLLLAVQPVQVGATAWIGGRTDAFGVCFAAICGWALLRGCRTDGARSAAWHSLAVSALMVGMFAKEQVAVLAVMVPPALTWFRPDGSNPWRRLAAALPYVAAVGLFVRLGMAVGFPKPAAEPAPVGEQALLIGRTLWHYFLLLWTPWPALQAIYAPGAIDARSVPAALGGYLVAGLCVFAAAYALLRRDRPVAWLAALGILAIAPVTGIVPLPFILLAPYRAALSGIAVAGILAHSLVGVARHRAIGEPYRIPAWRAVAALVVCAWWTGVTAASLEPWMDEQRFFTHLVSVNPEAVVGRYMRAKNLVDTGRDADAVPHMRAMLDTLFGTGLWNDPGYAARALRSNPAVRRRVLQNQGNDDKPEQFTVLLMNQLGWADIRLQRWADATQVLLSAEAIDPADHYAQLGLATAQIAMQRPADAVTRLERLTRSEAPNPYTYQLLGSALIALGRYEEARAAQQTAARLQVRPGGR